jgi:GxxExxY protein
VEHEADPFLFKEETFRLRGAFFRVYRAMGHGFLEAVYQECLAIEFAKRNIPFVAQAPLSLRYEGQVLRQAYQADFVCFDRIVVELKAVRVIAPEHRAQLFNYLKATDLELGLLVNFGRSAGVEIERFARSKPSAHSAYSAVSFLATSEGRP